MRSYIVSLLDGARSLLNSEIPIEEVPMLSLYVPAVPTSGEQTWRAAGSPRLSGGEVESCDNGEDTADSVQVSNSGCSLFNLEWSPLSSRRHGFWHLLRVLFRRVRELLGGPDIHLQAPTSTSAVQFLTPCLRCFKSGRSDQLGCSPACVGAGTLKSTTYLLYCI